MNRLRWRCRRGMLELDLMLQQVLEQDYPKLDAAERSAFEHLLEQSDQDLSQWLLGTGAPADPSLQGLVQRLQASLRERSA